MKVSRNATCPCGSGEKFKNCCEVSPGGRINFELLSEAVDQTGMLIDQVLEILQGEQFDFFYGTALDQFCGGLSPGAVKTLNDSEIGAQLFIEWLLFGEPLNEGLNSMKIIGQTVLEDLDLDGESEVVKLVENFSDSNFSLYRVSAFEDTMILIEDIFLKESHLVCNFLQERLPEESLVTGRVLKAAGGKLLFSAYANFPTDDPFQSLMSQFTSMGAENPELSPVQCLKIFQQPLLQSVLEEISRRSRDS